MGLGSSSFPCQCQKRPTLGAKETSSTGAKETYYMRTFETLSAFADQTSVKRDLLWGQKRPTICGLLRALPSPSLAPRDDKSALLFAAKHVERRLLKGGEEEDTYGSGGGGYLPLQPNA
jgi:hypothetical protein